MVNAWRWPVVYKDGIALCQGWASVVREHQSPPHGDSARHMLALLTLCLFHVGSPFATLAQHQTNTGSALCVHWVEMDGLREMDEPSRAD